MDSGRGKFTPEIYDHWTEGNRTYLVMEFIAGKTLAQIIDQHGQIQVAEAEKMFKVLLAHLHKLHSVSIIHRDIKPENISRTPDGRLVLLDFGISKQNHATMTAAKALSPYYSSPEQTLGQPTDVRSDLYSLGATIYHLVTGKTVAPALMRLSHAAHIPQPKQLVPEISEAFNRALLVVLALKPEQRPDSATSTIQLLMRPNVQSATGHTQRLPQSRTVYDLGVSVRESSDDPQTQFDSDSFEVILVVGFIVLCLLMFILLGAMISD